ncbi:hypothetical protein GCM10009834_42100 [Streptomonospora arabica]|uniref:Uncharacterized protein n=1 Tax=Streptomonospora halophila TaxID=427369 RepID=A0ABP9GHJ1_9ACTN
MLGAGLDTRALRLAHGSAFAPGRQTLGDNASPVDELIVTW